MKKLTKTLLFTFTMAVLLSLSNLMNAQDKQGMEKILEPFPKAAEGMVRHIIEMKKKSNESNLMIEIIPGKIESVDCNIHRLIGTLEEKNLDGWGYTYYEFTSEGKMISTMMMCNKPNEDKFVTGDTKMVRYNSKLPIVIYAPKGFDIKYKIWKAGKEKVAIER